MNKGIPCFDYTEIGPKGQKRIRFEFVEGDDELPSACTISLGDLDPMTGEPILDWTVFREYHRQRNREIYGNKKAVACPLSGQEKEARRELRTRIAVEFRQKYGYTPDQGTLKWLVNEQMPRQYRLEIDACCNEEGKSWTESVPEFADPAAEEAFREAEEDGKDPLVLFAAGLKGKEREVFRLLQLKADGVVIHGMFKDLARKWGMDPARVSQIKKRIGLKLIRFLKEQAE